MKQLLIIIGAAFALLLTKPAAAQAVLNEIYADPGSNNHEFFEQYNTSTAATPVSMDAYTLITYYEHNAQNKGFYVLDLPNYTVGPKGYFVGASQMPFNYQGNQKCTTANFSWNDPELSSKHGYLKAYQLSSIQEYMPATVPTNLNDLFNRRNGGGASYITFVYHKGELVNAFFGGTGGNLAVPSFILSLPPLTVDVVTEDSTSTFTIDFSAFANSAIEGVTETSGSDNGFIRTRDGLCNAWGKSSANAQHTPGASNGGAAGIAGSLSLSTHLTIGATPADSSFIHYNITSGPTALFPVNLQIYLDNGVVAGQLDSADQFVSQNTEFTVTDGAFTTRYMPQYANLLVVAETSVGCLDQIRPLVAPEKSAFTTLPLSLSQVTATRQNAYTRVAWAVDANESIQQMQVEKSYDGNTFVPAVEVKPTPRKGTEEYRIQIAEKNAGKVFYRVKLTAHNNKTLVSKTIAVVADHAAALHPIQNPVHNVLSLKFVHDRDDVKEIAIYNIAGIKVGHRSMRVHKGENLISMPVSQLSAGTYIVQIINANSHATARFIKQ